MTDCPQPFQGSLQERRANYSSHRWDGGTDARCVLCDCKAGGITSFWPCGVEPPRIGVGMLAVGYAPIDAMAEAEEREPGGIA